MCHFSSVKRSTCVGSLSLKMHNMLQFSPASLLILTSLGVI